MHSVIQFHSRNSFDAFSLAACQAGKTA